MHDLRVSKNRIQAANARFAEMRKLFFSRTLPTRLKSLALRAYIYPTLTWASETWILATVARKKLQTWWNKRARICLGVTKKAHIPMDTIFERTGLEEIYEMLCRRRLKYLGHIVRYPVDRWVRKTVAAARPEKARNRGRPKSTWLNETVRTLRARNGALIDCYDKARWRDITKKNPKPKSQSPTVNQSGH